MAPNPPQSSQEPLPPWEIEREAPPRRALPAPAAPHPYYDVSLHHDGDDGPSAPRDPWLRRFRECNSSSRPPRYTFKEAALLKLSFWKNPLHWLYALALGVIILIFIWQTSLFWVATLDDAYISFRFSENLAHGEGLRFNPGGPRVEGYTNFLWMVTLAGAIRIGEITGLGCDVMLISKLMGMFYAILTIITSFQFSRELRGRDDPFNLFPPLFIACNAHFGHWSVQGLETIGAVFWVFYSYYRFHKEMHDPRAWLISPLAAVAAALTRIDSLFYLSPLGVYGFVLIFQAKLPIRRLFIWGLMAAVPFGIYFWSKLMYFEDPAPNTYYAKQKNVTEPHRTRGKAHIFEFYWNQNGWGGPPPPPAPWKRPASVKRGFGEDLEYWIWFAAGGEHNAIWWRNWWFASALVLVFFARWRTALLILLPLGMNLYYVRHVDGDWMPNFRFLMMAVPFLGMAGAAAIGVAQDLSKKWRLPLRESFRLPLYLFFFAALIGLCAEQTRTGWVSVFYKDPMGYQRAPSWVDYRTWDGFIASVKKNYSTGFSTALPECSKWMLMNTQKGTILQSDIGLPLWFCAHLDLIDYDGLTDKHFGHAPSVLGKIKPLEWHYAETLKMRGLKPPTLSDRAAIAAKKLLGLVSKEQPASDPYGSAMIEAKRKFFEAQTARNVDYIYDQVKPEYMLFYYTPAETPGGKVWPYPEEAARVYNDPRRERDYVHMDSSVGKEGAGSVRNNFYRRKDVPVGVPDQIKARRLKRILELNPRLYTMYSWAYAESNKLADPAAKAMVRKIVLANIPRIKGHPEAMRELTSYARQANDAEITGIMMESSLKSAPEDPSLWRARADVAWEQGRREEAVKHLRKAAELSPPSDNSHYYHLVYFYETLRQPEQAAWASRTAISRNPGDVRAWTDLGAVALRVSWDTSLPLEKQLEHKKNALEGFSGVLQLQGETASADVKTGIEQLKKDIAELEKKIAEKGNAPPGAPEQVAPPMAPQEGPTTPSAAGEPPPMPPPAHDGPTTPTSPSDGAAPEQPISPEPAQP